MSNNPKVLRIIQVCRDIENSRRNIQRSKDREREFKDEKERVLLGIRKHFEEGANDNPEQSILWAATLINDERRQVMVQSMNERRERARIEELDEMVG